MDAIFNAVFVLGSSPKAESMGWGIGPVFGSKVKRNAESERTGPSTALINPGCLDASERDARKLVPADIFLLSPFPFDGIRLRKIAQENRFTVAARSNPTSKERWNHSLSAFSFK